MVLRLHVPGGSGDWSLCTGRERSQRSDHSAGFQERPRQEDGAAGGGTAAAPGTSSPHLAHHSTAQQPAASGQWKRQSGSRRCGSRGELAHSRWENLIQVMRADICQQMGPIKFPGVSGSGGGVDDIHTDLESPGCPSGPWPAEGLRMRQGQSTPPLPAYTHTQTPEAC